MRRRVQTRLVGLAGADGFLHGVVDFEDNSLGAVVAILLLLILSADDRERIHDEGHGIARGWKAGFKASEISRCLALHWAPVPLLLRRQVEVKEGGIQFTTEPESAILVPPERRGGPATVSRKWL